MESEGWERKIVHKKQKDGGKLVFQTSPASGHQMSVCIVENGREMTCSELSAGGFS